MTSENPNLLLLLKQASTPKQMSQIFDEFYQKTAHLVFRFCRKKGLSQEISEDIVQTVYMQIFNKRAKYNPEHSPLAWLYVVTRSETKDHLKAQRTYQNYLNEFSEFLSQTDSESPSNDQEVDLNDYLKLLSPNEKMALEKRYQQDKDFSEIAIEMNLTSVNIRKLISRGIQKVKKNLNPSDDKE
jgi:RNA polymerase sigma-70 factor (ECF subfamily)